MSMKKKFTSDFHTYLGYSILISDILFAYGRNKDIISETSMITPNSYENKKFKKLPAWCHMRLKWSILIKNKNAILSLITTFDLQEVSTCLIF